MTRSNNGLHRPLAALAAVAALMATAAPALALNLLVTNDDGWDSDGAQALKRALTDAGHVVLLSAPAGQQSGSSAGINLGGLTITKERQDNGVMEFSVDAADDPQGAEPATSALVGINIAHEVFGGAPDLVVSGINAGANIGAAAQLSGTVGATIAALARNVGGAQVQGIGISTDQPCDLDEAEDLDACRAENRAHFEDVAAFVVRVIRQLEASARHGQLLPDDTSININYPALAPSEVAGVVVARQGRKLSLGGALVNLTLGCFGSCASLPVGGSLPGGVNGATPDPDQSDVKLSDATLFNQGFITIVPIEADYTAGKRNFAKTRARLRRLEALGH